MRIGDGRVIPAFMTQALTGKSLTVYGTGSQTRSLCYVKDTIEGLHLLGTKAFPKEMPSLLLVMNLGNPHEITMLDLARKIIAVTKSTSSITFEPLPEDDPRKRCPDISRAKEYLGWSPQVPLEAGLKEVLPYFASAIGAGS
jgi:nucleoside-diphosphate-sugar epimerase